MHPFPTLKKSLYFPFLVAPIISHVGMWGNERSLWYQLPNQARPVKVKCDNIPDDDGEKGFDELTLARDESNSKSNLLIEKLTLKSHILLYLVWGGVGRL